MRKRISAIMKVSVAGFVLLSTVIFSTFVLSGVVHAEPSDTEIMKKTLINAMTWCYQQPGYIESPISSEDVFYIGNVVHQEGKITVPTNIGNSLNNDTINCQQVFLGVQGFLSTKMEGLLALYNKNESTVRPANLGYVEGKNAISTGYKCFNLRYYLLSAPNYTTGNYYTSNSLCLPVDADGNIRMDNYQAITTENDSNVTSAAGSLRLRYDEWYSCVGYYSTPPSANETFALDSGHGCLAYPRDGESFNEFIDDVKESADYPGLSAILYLGDEWVNLYTFNQAASATVNIHNGAGSDYVSVLELENIDGMVVAQLTALRWLTGNNEDYNTRYTFNSNDWFYIYKTYVNRLLDSRTITLGEDCTTNKNKFTYAMTYDGKNWCEVVGAENVTGEFAGKNGTKYLTLKSFTDILNDLKDLDFNEVDDDALSDGPLQDIIGGSNGKPGVSAAEDPCYKAAGSLGWIVCPVIKIVSDTLVGVYDTMIQPFLEIKSNWLEVGSGQSIYAGWSVFRNFANIIFAILFLIVIFSQVTGFGLDNYGIKKVLPRLIMVAVLVNISFILCQLAVDVSNLLGSALQGLFEGLADDIQIPKVFDEISFTGKWFSLSGIVSTIFTTLFTGGVVAALVVSWEYWLIPFLLALLGCVIGVLFFFIVLGVRQAGVLILVALSPIAIVCYALPNTKSLFDKWKKMFIGLLVVYPICGLLIGGGQFASALLVSVDDGTNFFYDLVAMLVAVIPFFFIPSIVRGSMVAMGNIGMKMAGFGGRLGGGLQRMVGNSEGMKDWQRSLNMRHDNTIMTGLEERERGGGFVNGVRRRFGMSVKTGLSAGQRRKYMRAQSRFDRAAFEDVRALGAGDPLRAGTRAFETAVQHELSEKDRKEIMGQEELYYNGQVDGVDADRLTTVGAEHAKQLAALSRKVRDKEDYKDELIKVKALQNMLSKTDGGRNMLQNNISALASKSANLAANGDKTGLSLASSHLLDQHGDLYKSKNRAFHAMAVDLAAKDYRKVGDGTFATMTMPDDSISYRSSEYATSGLAKYDDAGLVGADDGALDRIIQGMGAEEITGDDALKIARTANKALANDNIAKNDHIKDKLQQIAVAGYALPTMRTLNGVTYGQEAIMQASNESLEQLAADIKHGVLSEEQKRAIQVNIDSALRNSDNIHTAESVERLYEVLRAAGVPESALPSAAGLKIRGTPTGGTP